MSTLTNKKVRTLSGNSSVVTQSCPTVCDPMDCSLPSSSVRGILQPFPSRGDLPDPETELGSPALQADVSTL